MKIEPARENIEDYLPKGVGNTIIEAKRLAMCKADSNAVLAEVRAIAEKALEGDGEFEPNYTKLYFKALLDIVNKVSEHFT